MTETETTPPASCMGEPPMSGAASPPDAGSGTCASPVQPTDIFRLNVCPNCDYSLEALPAEGVCPECGRHYDQRFIILAGQGRGRFETTWRRFIGDISAIGFLIVIVWNLQYSHVNALMIGWALFSVLYLSSRVYAWIMSPREVRMLLWLSSEGAGQAFSTPEARTAMIVSRHAWTFSVCVAIVLLSVLEQRRLWVSVSALAAFVGLGIVFLQLLRAQLRGNDSPTFHPRLRAWPWVSKIEIDENLNGRHRLILRLADSFWVSHSAAIIVDIEVPLDGGQIAQLQDIIETWTDGRLRCTVNNRPEADQHLQQKQAGR